MTELTEAGRQAIAEIASRHGVSEEAVGHVLMAVIAGRGTLAQFNHPDLGGMGQWSLGGMTMVGDMFNSALKARVEAICADVARLLNQSSPLHQSRAGSSQSQTQSPSGPESVSLFMPGGQAGNWWPDDLGHAASTGAQNRMRYAWFPQTRRLAINAGDGRVRVYDAGDHVFSGFSQQQSGDQSLSFTSQYGLVRLADLREIGVPPAGEEEEPVRPVTLSEALRRRPEAGAPSADAAAEHADHGEDRPAAVRPDPVEARSGAAAGADEADLFAKIERLAALHSKGILTDDEYQSKKAELLARI